jgi:hypothetical protein
MPSLRCPSCDRALDFPDALRGALVQCPACRHSFLAPEEGPPARPPLALPLASPEVPPAAPGPDPFDLAGPPGGPEVRPHAALRSAAWWLRSAVVLGFGTSLLGCCTLTVVSERPDSAFVILGGTAVFEYLPLILVAVAAPHLQARRNYGLCVAAAVFVLPPSLWALVQAWFAGRVGLTELARGEGAGFFFLALAAVTLFGAAAGVIGAVKAFALLSDAEVRRSFH